MRGRNDADCTFTIRKFGLPCYDVMESAYHPASPTGFTDLKRRIGDLIGPNNGYSGIVERASRLLKCPLSLWDHRGNIIAASETRTGDVATLTRDFKRLWTCASASREAIRSSLTLAGSTVVVLSVADGCGPEKMLIFLPREHDSAVEMCHAVATDLGFVLVVEGQRQHAVRATEERLRTSFRHELLDVVALSGRGLERVAERARALGYELATAYWVVVLEGFANEKADVERAPRRLFAERIARGNKRAMTIQQGDREVVLVPEDRLERDRFGRLSDALIEHIRTLGAESGARFYAGLSESSIPLGAIAGEVERINRNLDLNRSLGYRHELVVHENIRPYRLLMAVSETDDLLDYWGETIRDLYQCDLVNGTSLIKTLEVFFACNYNAIEASRKLYVHRNTMTRRLRRIEDILHVDFNDAEAAFRLQLAIRVHHIVISQQLNA